MKICDFLGRAAGASPFLVVASLAVPVSALAQPIAGNPTSAGGDDHLQFLSSGYWWNASRRPSKLCGYRQHALNHRSFLEGVSSPKPQQNA